MRAAESARTTHGARRRPTPAATSPACSSARSPERTSASCCTRASSSRCPVLGRQPLHPEVAEVAAGSFHAKEPPAIRGGGYVVEALEAALWALDEDADLRGRRAARRQPRRRRRHDRRRSSGSSPARSTASTRSRRAGGAGRHGRPDRRARRRALRARGPSRCRRPGALTRRSGAPPASRTPGDSYWVLDGQLLAGPYPGAPKKAEAAAKLDAFLDAGVTCFVDLTEEGEGPPLHPYAAPARARSPRPRALRVTHLRLPDPRRRRSDARGRCARSSTRSGSRSTKARRSTSTAGAASGAPARSSGACWWRTACRADDVLDRLAALRVGTERRQRASPETPEQRRFVVAWK